MFARPAPLPECWTPASWPDSPLPLAAELFLLAVSDTDFIADLDPATLADNAANSADLAADIWADRHHVAVPLHLIVAAREQLVEHGYRLLCEREQDAIDWRRDGQIAGDLDEFGKPIPYPRSV